MKTTWLPVGALVSLVVVAACGTLPPSPVGTEAFQKRERALHIDLFWNCQPAEAGALLIAGVAQTSDNAQPIRNLRFAATAYDKDGRRLTTAVGYPDGIQIGHEGWTRFRVRVPGGQAAARVDLGYEYRLPPGATNARSRCTVPSSSGPPGVRSTSLPYATPAGPDPPLFPGIERSTREP